MRGRPKNEASPGREGASNNLLVNAGSFEDVREKGTPSAKPTGLALQACLQRPFRLLVACLLGSQIAYNGELPLLIAVSLDDQDDPQNEQTQPENQRYGEHDAARGSMR